MTFRFRLSIIFALIVVLTILIMVTHLPPARSATSLGRLVFTDYPKPNYSFTVDVFDLDHSTRASLQRESYQDIGSLYVIDGQHFYMTLCLAQNNPMFCTAPVQTIVAPKDRQRFENIKQFWKTEYGSPAWSPDGTHITFNVVDSGTQNAFLFTGDTYVMDADGANVVDLTPKENINGFSFTWSPDSQYIAFACSNAQYLCISNFDGSHLQKLTLPQYTTVHDIAWSPDGSQIVFSLIEDSFPRHYGLYLVNGDGSNMRRLLGMSLDDYEDPVWSPDGSQIVFRSGEQGNNIGEIYAVKPDSSDLRNLSQSLNGSEFGAVWSPDGTQVAFFSWQEKQGMFLYVTDINRGTPHKITENSTWGITDVGSPQVFWVS